MTNVVPYRIHINNYLYHLILTSPPKFDEKRLQSFCARELIFSGKRSQRDDEEKVCARMTIDFFL